MGLLKGKVALVTGASSGIDLEIAKLFAAEGAKVAMVAKDAKKLQKAAEEVGGERLAVACDVSEEADVRKAFEAVMGKYGRLDIAINGAGLGRFANVADLEERNWDAVMDVNLKGVFLCCREEMRVMKRQKGGHIINVSSTSGKRGYAEGGAYCASKFGVRGFSEALAEEGKKCDVKVTIVCPGAVDTPFFEKVGWGGETKNMLRPLDVAELMLFIATRPQNVWLPEVVITHFYPVWED